MTGKWVLSAVFVTMFAVRAKAQVTAGEASMNLNGSVSAGYSGSVVSEGSSGQGMGFGGNATLSGSYHSPQFLSFEVAPFYNQSRNDSSFQSISESSGVTARVNIFSGSEFPGYVNTSEVYNSEGSFLLPGTANYRTNANTQTLGVGWSLKVPDLPSLSVGYQDGNSSSSIYGFNSGTHSNFQSIFGTSTYTLAGFHLGGGIHFSNVNSTFPQFITLQTPEATRANATTYNFAVSHGLGLDGSAWMNYSRNTTGYNVLGSRDSQTADVVNLGVSLKPQKKLSLSLGADYDDNLAGTIYQTANTAGVIVPLELPAQKSHSWGVYGDAQYNLVDHLYFSGNVTHREQLFLGTSFDSTAYSAGVSYGRDLWGGHFTTGTVVNESSIGNLGGSRLGVLSNAIYIRKIGLWNMSSSFGYSRNSQMLLLTYTSSGYSYSTSVSRRIGKLNWNGGAGGSKSMVSGIQGTTSTAQTYSTGLSTSKIGMGAGYSRSSGMGLYTVQGIAALPGSLPPTVLPLLIRYGGTTYSLSAGGRPKRGLTFNGSFAKTRSATENGSLSSNNMTEEGNVYLQYSFRKVFLTAGYSRLIQGFSASPLAPSMLSTYYVGLSRWFNFF